MPQADGAVPRQYVVYRADTPLVIDGALDEIDWRAAPWTELFIDIRGEGHPAPRHATRAKMLWDAEAFYVAAVLHEPHLWGTLTERDSVIFRDNDFEIFIDPDGDTHAYYELEINALGTVWDLLLPRPYRDGGRAIDSWDVAGLDVGIQLRGTLNDASDTDDGWTVEIALPWSVLEEAAAHAGPPADGETWRVNFSRVQWQLEVDDGGYAKVTDPGTGRPVPEDNWVWSPQHAIDMHRPEHWGYVQFATAPPTGPQVAFVPDPDQAIRAALRELYYRQRALFRESGRYASRLDELGPVITGLDESAFRPELESHAAGWVISAPASEGRRIFIRADGRSWSEE